MIIGLVIAGIVLYLLGRSHGKRSVAKGFRDFLDR